MASALPGTLGSDSQLDLGRPVDEKRSVYFVTSRDKGFVITPVKAETHLPILNFLSPF